MNSAPAGLLEVVILQRAGGWARASPESRLTSPIPQFSYNINAISCVSCMVLYVYLSTYRPRRWKGPFRAILNWRHLHCSHNTHKRNYFLLICGRERGVGKRSSKVRLNALFTQEEKPRAYVNSFVLHHSNCHCMAKQRRMTCGHYKCPQRLKEMD